jgi:hypothetical protein
MREVLWCSITVSWKLADPVTALGPCDDALHVAGKDANWNESRYFDFFDAGQDLAGWMRVGQRINEGHAELSICLHLPDGKAAFGFSKVPIAAMSDSAGGLSFEVVRPFEHCRASFEGSLSLLANPHELLEAGKALRNSPHVPVSLNFDLYGRGLGSVLGADQADVAAIFLPGQALGHYQHLVRCSGSLQVGGRLFQVSGRGTRDQSWGPRNWHSKRWFRWLCGAIDDDSGFMLTRSLGHGASRVGGFMREGSIYHRIDSIELRTERCEAQVFQRSINIVFRSGSRQWQAHGTAMASVPLRHHQGDAELRIVKAPTRWTLHDGRQALGISEYHDMIEFGVPAGLEF